MGKINLQESYLGIELGSSRIKSVLIDQDARVLARGIYPWENEYRDGIWTYAVDAIHKGLQGSYSALRKEVEDRYGGELREVGAIGLSGMMHGYIALNERDEFLVPFRTWRNNLQGEASKKLTELFHYPIPQRWTIAHLYQALLKGEDHRRNISFLTTLGGYIHYRLTGEKIVGIGDASGIFPLDLGIKDYDRGMVRKFEDLTRLRLEGILPAVRLAGEGGGGLTRAGAAFLDPTGKLRAGIPLCPPEGDAGTGMVATNSVAKRTGNISAGTSLFAMVVLEEKLKAIHEEIDQVATPCGNLVAMIHCNNGTSDLNSWIGLLREGGLLMGGNCSDDELYGRIYAKALEGEENCGGLMTYGYLSGEHITGFEEGRPLFVRNADSRFNLANFVRAHLYSSLCALRIGMDILTQDEGRRVSGFLGHGGFFKTKGVGERIMAAALNVPITTRENAGEGGPWGMAILALYAMDSRGESLEDFLNNRIFKGTKTSQTFPTAGEVKGFEEYLERYKRGLEVERAGVGCL